MRAPLGARVEHACLWGVAVLSALPLLLEPYLPFLDYPQHLALASVVHHLHDPAFDFARTFQLDLRPLPYWGFYGPVHLLAFVVPLRLAARLTLFLAALLLAPGLRALLAAFGRDTRLAFLALPLIWNTNLYMGFVSFFVAVPLFLFAVAATERLLCAPTFTWRRALPAGLWAVAVYFGHGQVFLLYVCALLWLSMVHALGGGPRRIRRCVPFLPALALGAYWIGAVVLAPASEVGAREHLKVLGRLGVLGRVRWDPVAESLGKMRAYLWDVQPGWRDDLPFLVLFAALGALVAWRWGHALWVWGRGREAEARRTPRSLLGRVREGVVDLRLEGMALGLVASYFVSPMEIGLQWYVYPRHLLLAALLLPALLPCPDEPGAGYREAVRASRWRRARALARRAWPALAALVALVVAWQAHGAARAFARQAEGFDAVLAAASPGGRTLGLIFDNGGGGPVRVWPFLHFAAYLQAEKGGDLGFSFAGLPSIPVRYRPGAQAPHPYEWRPETFRIATYARYYDRYLIRGRPRGDARRLLDAGGRVVRAGSWTLVETPDPKAFWRQRGTFGARRGR